VEQATKSAAVAQAMSSGYILPMPPQPSLPALVASVTAEYRSISAAALDTLATDLLGARLAEAVISSIEADEAAIGPKAGWVFPCRKGCAWCCRGTKIHINAHEAILLAKTVRARPDFDAVRKRVSEAAAAFRTLSPAERWAAQTACPFLGDGGACSVYDVRPIQCRACHSLDDLACERAHKDQGPETKQMDVFRSAVYAAVGFGVGHALSDRGLDGRPLEFSNAVLVALEQPDAAARWAKGETVFDAAAFPPDPDEIEAVRAMQEQRARRERNERKRKRRETRGR
jgi:Fe-S-cluster containining protein